MSLVLEESKEESDIGNITEENSLITKTKTFFNEEPPKTKCYEIKSCQDFFVYIREHPRAAFTISLYIIGFLFLSFLTLIYSLTSTYNDDIFLGSAIGGLVLCIYGSCTFSTLLRLKQNIDEYSSKNKKFKKINIELSSDIFRLEKANNFLYKTRNSLAESIDKMGLQLIKFNECQQTLNKVTKGNLIKVKEFVNVSKNVNKRFNEKLITKQKKILMQCLDNTTEFKKKGYVDQKGYQSFLKSLPPIYKQKMNNVGHFRSIAGSDMKMDIDEFGNALDRFARESNAHKINEEWDLTNNDNNIKIMKWDSDIDINELKEDE